MMYHETEDGKEDIRRAKLEAFKNRWGRRIKKTGEVAKYIAAGIIIINEVIKHI